MKTRIVASSVLTCVLLSLTTFADEGMYPISDIARLELSKRGLEMDPAELFNPDKTCLVDGICRVNGCTGSFVSPDGLIITNHHCAYRAIQSASTPENDLLRNGFQAAARSEEIPATGYTVRITESYEDVSAKILSAVTPGMDPGERTRAIQKRGKELERDAEAANPGTRAEVAEMFTGRTWVLFLYTYLTDVRLVFAPPASIGAFGGDIDNWEWPRHTGDFSFMRAYTAPDGSSADYSADNIPYRPRRSIRVAPQGVDDGDFVFLLGYPGRTARHKTASFLRYEENVRLPFIVDLYQWQIDTMAEAGRDNRAVALKHSSRSKSLANVEKRSRGQLKGLRRKQLVAERERNEADLQKWIASDDERQQRYGHLLSELDKVYGEMTDRAQFELTLSNLRTASRAFGFAFLLHEAAIERKKDDLDRESPYMDRNFGQTVQRMMLGHRDLDISTDKQLLLGMLQRLAAIPEAKKIGALAEALENIGDAPGFVDRLYSNTRVTDASFLRKSLEQTPEQLAAADDAFLQLIAELYPTYLELRKQDKGRSGRLNELYGLLTQAKMEFLKTNFVPDANATLRLTYGNIRGYSPEDAVYKSPITTLRGVIDKTTGEEPFITPQRVIDKYEAGDFGPFVHAGLGQVPVAILYNTDTTGGNSGSPIFNARGELVGVNFDRAFEATINDFAWNAAYSRSLGVDIRYVLWLTGRVYGANHLLKEMGVK